MSLQEELKDKFLIKNQITDIYPQSIPASFNNYLSNFDNDHPLNRQFQPSLEELNQEDGLYDPIGDSIHSKGHGIIHRYKNRLLFTPTTVCPIQCRYCFRKNELAQKDELFQSSLSALSTYLENNPEINEVILTGGDPLMLSDSKLSQIMNHLIGKIKYLRLHTRTPIIIPKRIDNRFIELIKKYQNSFSVITMAIHTNHADELSHEVIEHLNLLNETKANLISQTVLLRNVNDSVDSLCELFEKLSTNKIRPYYLHHPDKVKGAMHFYLKIETGRKLYGELRDNLPGWMLPHYVIDPANGKGKTLAYNGEHLEFSGTLIDRFGSKYSYSD